MEEFQPYTDFKIGDTAVCIDNADQQTYLTLGKEYVVRDFDKYDYCINVLDNDGTNSWYFDYRFKKMNVDIFI